MFLLSFHFGSKTTHHSWGYSGSNIFVSGPTTRISWLFWGKGAPKASLCHLHTSKSNTFCAQARPWQKKSTHTAWFSWRGGVQRTPQEELCFPVSQIPLSGSDRLVTMGCARAYMTLVVRINNHRHVPNDLRLSSTMERYYWCQDTYNWRQARLSFESM